MSQAVTLHLSDELIERAREVAAQTRRPLEDVLIEWLHDGAGKPPIASLTDEQVLALADLQLDAATQQELSDLLALSREGALDEAGHGRLDELMDV